MSMNKIDIVKMNKKTWDVFIFRTIYLYLLDKTKSWKFNIYIITSTEMLINLQVDFAHHLALM